MHCDIEFNSSTGIAVLRDLQSRNGTFVNSERVQSADVPLMHGDYIRAGYDPENFKFEYANPPAQGARSWRILVSDECRPRADFQESTCFMYHYLNIC